MVVQAPKIGGCDVAMAGSLARLNGEAQSFEAQGSGCEIFERGNGRERGSFVDFTMPS